MNKRNVGREWGEINRHIRYQIKPLEIERPQLPRLIHVDRFFFLFELPIFICELWRRVTFETFAMETRNWQRDVMEREVVRWSRKRTDHDLKKRGFEYGQLIDSNWISRNKHTHAPEHQSQKQLNIPVASTAFCTLCACARVTECIFNFLVEYVRHTVWSYPYV